ncbi:dihydroxy-acid dehydratase [Aeoliella sp. ICT_H6.2]|uniref:Dihydroxy-acid dehydratase n=1 Tax=Aeoliella straminimaris TaxID=2954799 RepID=A0A9X2JG19_9BACT|nr:IlvD/Edd family dehydratase [Aeoliella straminimaris]MCO6044261.1 dihydroxy-acid dehydratase [Aeoliella straminimaris]
MKFRSSAWFGGDGQAPFSHRAWFKSQGFAEDTFDHDRPIVGICNSWSELNNCNSHFRELAEAVKRGVWEAGGIPAEFPTISLGEPFIKPTTMLYRNLMSMDVEEMIVAHPIDSVVLLCGCDKTTPAQVMGAVSADLPAIMLTGGPMLRGQWRGNQVASGTDVWKYWDQCRLGQLSKAAFSEIEGCMARSNGHCMTMGTASTMTSLVEAMGLTLPHCAAIPAVDSRRMAIAQQTGRRAVELAKEGLRPSRLLTQQALENAITVNHAIGGSTNAVIHLLAIAGRLGLPIGLDDIDRLSRTTPMIANIMPSGKFLMEDFYYAGGVPAVMHEIRDLLHLEARTVNGRTVGQNLEEIETYNRDVIRPTDNPVCPEGGTIVLRGNLCPNGAILKQSAASQKLLCHRGPAIVFDSREDMLDRIHQPDFEVQADSVLVLRNVGPVGGPGMPEWGHMPIPQKLLEQGVHDIVRISDARMSGTSFGTNVLHLSPEAAVGGPLGLVQPGDIIHLDAAHRRLTLEVSDEELTRRREAWVAPSIDAPRGYLRLYLQHVLQADKGCDFDFLRGSSPERCDLSAKYATMS